MSFPQRPQNQAIGPNPKAPHKDDTLAKSFINERVLLDILEYSPSVIFLKDVSGRYQFANRAMLKVVGRELGEVIGKTDYELFPRNTADAYREIDRRALETGKACEYEEEAPHADGMHPYLTIKFPIFDNEGLPCGVAGIATDVLSLKDTENLLRERVNFERLLFELSATFANVTADEVDTLINETLRRLGEFMQVDRCFLGQFSEDKKEFRFTHFWVRESVWADEMLTAPFLTDAAHWFTGRMLSKQSIIFSNIDEIPDDAVFEKEYIRGIGIKSSAILPLIVDGNVIGNFGIEIMRREKTWPAHLVQSLQLFGELFSNVLVRKRSEKKLHQAFSEIEQLKNRLEAENLYLQKEIGARSRFGRLIGSSSTLKQMLGQIEQVAPTEATVLIVGETGSGKELVARAIHELSKRKDRTMVTVNCTALPATLIENELFGREKGAYTGALSKQLGRFEIADGSTIFLDEVGDLPLDLQAKLLRVLEQGEFQRLGSPETVKVDVRMIAATNRDLHGAVEKGQLRSDLYFRLNVFPIEVPPLRQRREDIPALVWEFVKEFSSAMGKNVDSIPRTTMKTLRDYHWPGNVRELRNVIERAMILSTGPVLRVELPQVANQPGVANRTLEEVEKRHIHDVLETSGWRVRGRFGAAEILGLKPTTLEARMKKLGITRDR